MNNHVDIILTVIMIPMLLVMFFYEYPAKWSERKFIFGVRNREEFKEQKTAVRIGKITASARKQALIIMMISFVLMGLIMLIPDLFIRTAIWILFVLAVLVIIMVPFMRANHEMKSLKREIGISSASGTVYTDLKGAGAVHALKVTDIIIPDAVAAAFFIMSLLADLKIIDLSGLSKTAGQHVPFSLTAMTGSFFFIGLILLPVAVLMDRIRNDVISTDSDTNMNYNRAKKKLFADMFVLMSWANTIMIAASFALVFISNGNITMLIMTSLYMMMLMASIIVFAKKNIDVDKRYREKTTIDVDDDDNWILGSIYFNPDDKRLNVAKRMGIGGTINVAHPAGKAITVIGLLLMTGIISALPFFDMLGRSSMNVRIENGMLICSQMTDSIKVPVDLIEDARICEYPSELHLQRQYGFELPPLHSGTYIVDGEYGCKVFLNTDSEVYVTFRYDGKTYYINGADKEETMEVFGNLAEG